jgi:uncharacterized protein YndB with AHSA1/START domain
MARDTRVQRRVVFPAGCWEVWSALTRAEELARWFGTEVVSVEPRPGGRLVARDAAGRLHRAVVEVADAPRRFAFRWLPALAGPGGGGEEFLPGSCIDSVIEETGGATAVTVVETAPAAAIEPVWASGPVFAGGAPATPGGPATPGAPGFGGPPLIQARA